MKTIEIQYVGNHNPRGIYEVPKKRADILLESDVWEMPGQKVKSGNKVQVTEKVDEKVPGDLNNDGVFDEKDVSIGAKVMRRGRELKK